MPGIVFCKGAGAGLARPGVILVLLVRLVVGFGGRRKLSEGGEGAFSWHVEVALVERRRIFSRWGMALGEVFGVVVRGGRVGGGGERRALVLVCAVEGGVGWGGRGVLCEGKV